MTEEVRELLSSSAIDQQKKTVWSPYEEDSCSLEIVKQWGSRWMETQPSKMCTCILCKIEPSRPTTSTDEIKLCEASTWLGGRGQMTSIVSLSAVLILRTKRMKRFFRLIELSLSTHFTSSQHSKSLCITNAMRALATSMKPFLHNS